MSSSSSSSTTSHRWQKVLYRRQSFPDNHFDETFLASLVTNANIRHYEYWSMVKSTAGVVQQISALCIFFLIVALLRQSSSDTLALAVAGGDVLLLASLSVAFVCSGPRFFTPSLLPDPPTIIKYAAIMVAVLLVLTPVLSTLTRGTSDDTIIAQTIFLASLHIVFHPYRVTQDSSSVSSALSFNAAMLSAVLLASRLPSHFQVFLCIVLAIQVFALFPLVRDYIRVRSEFAHLTITVGMCLTTVVLQLVVSSGNYVLPAIYAAAIAFIWFACPLWMLYMQQYKHEIRGPWDVASVGQFRT